MLSAAMSVRSTIAAALTPMAMAIVSEISSRVAPNFRAFLTWPSRQPWHFAARLARDRHQLLGLAVEDRGPVGLLVELEVDLAEARLDHGVGASAGGAAPPSSSSGNGWWWCGFSSLTVAPASSLGRGSGSAAASAARAAGRAPLEHRGRRGLVGRRPVAPGPAVALAGHDQHLGARPRRRLEVERDLLRHAPVVGVGHEQRRAGRARRAAAAAHVDGARGRSRRAGPSRRRPGPPPASAARCAATSGSRGTAAGGGGPCRRASGSCCRR